MELHPHAKINLGLLIKGKRPDGYHLLETLFLPVHELRDHMWLEHSDRDGHIELQLQGIELDGNPEDNLVVKAYRALQQYVDDLPGVKIILEKHIPAGGGLGGGSSDAAFALKGLNKFLELGVSQRDLVRIAAGLGADVPFFLYDRPMLATGTGSELQTFDLPLPYRIELITPPIHSSTIAAYKALDYTQFDPNRSLEDILRRPVSAWQKYLPNDLEVPVFSIHPEIKQYKESLYEQGAVYAAMSGSGSACFGLFES